MATTATAAPKTIVQARRCRRHARGSASGAHAAALRAREAEPAVAAVAATEATLYAGIAADMTAALATGLPGLAAEGHGKEAGEMLEQAARFAADAARSAADAYAVAGADAVAKAGR